MHVLWGWQAVDMGTDEARRNGLKLLRLETKIAGDFTFYPAFLLLLSVPEAWVTNPLPPHNIVRLGWGGGKATLNHHNTSLKAPYDYVSDPLCLWLPFSPPP